MATGAEYGCSDGLPTIAQPPLDSDPSGGAENYEADFQAMLVTLTIRK